MRRFLLRSRRLCGMIYFLPQRHPKSMPADITTTWPPSFVIMTPLTEAGTRWLCEYLFSEGWFGPVCVEHRDIADIVLDARDEPPWQGAACRAAPSAPPGRRELAASAADALIALERAERAAYRKFSDASLALDRAEEIFRATHGRSPAE